MWVTGLQAAPTKEPQGEGCHGTIMVATTGIQLGVQTSDPMVLEPINSASGSEAIWTTALRLKASDKSEIKPLPSTSKGQPPSALATAWILFSDTCRHGPRKENHSVYDCWYPTENPSNYQPSHHFIHTFSQHLLLTSIRNLESGLVRKIGKINQWFQECFKCCDRGQRG